MVGLMGTSLKRAYATPSLLPPEPLPLQQSTGDTQTQFGFNLCGVSGSWCTQGLVEPSDHLWWVWVLILSAILLLLPSSGASPLPLDVGISAQLLFQLQISKNA